MKIRKNNLLDIAYKASKKLKLGRAGMSCVYCLNKIFNKPSLRLNEDEALQYLHLHHKDVKSSSLTENKVLSPTCDLQIIMPVYNTGSFLKESIVSVLSQDTKYKFHLVIVNDGSTDCSRDILSEFASDDRVTIIHQENKGFSGARNTALKKIFGQYLTFLDSDDILAPGAITNWLDAAYKYNADVVEGSFQRRNLDGELFGGVKWEKESIADKSQMQGYAWLKVYRASLWQNIKFPEKYWYEDTIICGLLLPLIRVYVQIPDYVYYYTINRNGISFNSRGKTKSIDNIYITISVLRDAEQLGLIKSHYEYYASFILTQFHTNWDRTRLLGADIELAIFIESCRLFGKYFTSNSNFENIPARMRKALREKDFNLYRKSNLFDF